MSKHYADCISDYENLAWDERKKWSNTPPWLKSYHMQHCLFRNEWWEADR